MSRLGPKPMTLPDKVKVQLEGKTLTVSGPGGMLKRALPEGFSIKIAEKEVQILRQEDSAKMKALHGLWRKIILNMMDGVSKGFSKALDIIGVGYRANVSGQALTMHLGLSHAINFNVPAGIKATVDKQNSIRLDGADKELLGQVAAQIRSLRPPEPYKGTGIRYQGEHIVRKAGKTGAMGAGGGAAKK